MGIAPLPVAWPSILTLKGGLNTAGALFAPINVLKMLSCSGFPQKILCFPKSHRSPDRVVGFLVAVRLRKLALVLILILSLFRVVRLFEDQLDLRNFKSPVERPSG